MPAFCLTDLGLRVALDAGPPSVAPEDLGDPAAIALQELMRVEDLVERDRRPAPALGPAGRLLDRTDVRALLVDHDQQLERRVALRARDADDPGGLELAEHADIRPRVVLAAHAAVVPLGLIAQEAEDVHLPAVTLPTRSGVRRASADAKKAS